MKTKLLLALLAAIFFCLNCGNKTGEEITTKGYLFIIGGGDRSASMMKRFIELADGFNNGKIIVIPMASADPKDTAEYQTNQMRQLGAKNVSFLILSREEAMADSSVNKLDGTTGIFFSGGVQTRLMEIIGETPFADKIIQLYREGAVIGGTSAGAAVMSEVMITGDERRPDEDEENAFNKIEGSNIITKAGFGFLNDVVIDQHFVRRKRHNRLISIIIENPQLVGVGIDEGTAVIVDPSKTFEVVGQNSVVIYDASKATVAAVDTTKSFNLTASNITLHVLTNGYKFNLLTKKIVAPTAENQRAD